MRKCKKRICGLLVALALLAGVPALAQVTFQGTVVSSKTITVNAPFGGIVDEITLRKGDPIQLGGPVATIRTTKVFAEMDGTVSGIFAREGDQTEGITERYGAVMYIEPVNRYVVSATTEKAYNSSETRYIHIGERVHLACTKDGTHVGTAVVTNVGGETSGDSSSGDSSSGSSSTASYTTYKLEVTSGDFYMGETVGIYRDSDHSSESRIGRGTIKQNAAVAVKGTGSILKMHVQVGDRVERGEVLFETVEGVLDGLYAMDNIIYSPLNGIVATVDAVQGSAVEKNGKLISIYPEEAMQVAIKVSELDLREIHEGDKVSIEFEWDLDGTRQVPGVVSSISRVGEEQTDKNSDAQYTAYINFTPDETVRLDMTVSVYTQADSDEPDPEEALFGEDDL
ncbi:MAG: HlyD family efflux transporter periplasmic adaptor subunit [Clostridia bacterium]|nr:HlyD family efflux transporter periplasmic adaptor subunit [Clostridia bacterium]